MAGVLAGGSETALAGRSSAHAQSYLARTAIDLAAAGRPIEEVKKVLDRAETRQVFDLRRMEEALDAAGRRPGTRVIRNILASYTIGADITESEREDDFFRLCDQFGIPRPLSNRPMKIGGREIRPDFWWPDIDLVVEVDGYGTHGTRQGFTKDRQRDRNVLINSDLSLLRFDAEEVRGEAGVVARDVKAMRSKLLRR